MITFAVPKGRIFKEISDLLLKCNFPKFDYKSASRNLVVQTENPDVRILVVRSQDVPTYVSYGAADLGVVGSDVLDECESESVYQPLDLKIGSCRLSVAVQNTKYYKSLMDSEMPITIATKYPRQA